MYDVTICVYAFVNLREEARGRISGHSRGYNCGDEENESTGACGHKGERVAHNAVQPGRWLNGALRVSKAGWVKESG
jgi:hypothetical protein